METQGKPEIEIMPKRLMASIKAEDFAELLKDTGMISEVLFQRHEYSGGGYVVGRFILITSALSPEDVIEKIRPLCDQVMPYGYYIRVGRFTKPRPTVKDYIKGRV
ncbi:MAG: methyl-coenzyme M reductase operon protein D [Candidatus Methanomethylicaceae archaeon]